MIATRLPMGRNSLVSLFKSSGPKTSNGSLTCFDRLLTPATLRFSTPLSEGSLYRPPVAMTTASGFSARILDTVASSPSLTLMFNLPTCVVR